MALSLAAVRRLKNAALVLAGLPRAEADDGLYGYSCSLAEDFVRCGLPEKMRAGFTTVLRACCRLPHQDRGAILFLICRTVK
jgi:hypothetical protein